MPFEGAVKQAYSKLTAEQQVTAYQFMLFLGSLPASSNEASHVNPITFNSLKGKISIEPNFDDPVSAFEDYM